MTHRDVGYITLDRYNELCEEREGLAEMLGDTEAQHRSETYAFGDSWPGAQIQIAKMREGLAELDQDLEFMARVLRASEEMPEPAEPGFDDIPF